MSVQNEMVQELVNRSIRLAASIDELVKGGYLAADGQLQEWAFDLKQSAEQVRDMLDDRFGNEGHDDDDLVELDHEAEYHQRQYAEREQQEAADAHLEAQYENDLGLGEIDGGGE